MGEDLSPLHADRGGACRLFTSDEIARKYYRSKSTSSVQNLITQLCSSEYSALFFLRIIYNNCSSYDRENDVIEVLENDLVIFDSKNSNKKNRDSPE